MQSFTAFVSQLITWATVAFPVFIGVLGIICMVKIIQISEDVRRTRNAIYEDVRKPTPHYLLVIAAAAVAVFATVIVFMTGHYLSAFGIIG